MPMIRLRKILTLLCPILSSLCLVIGYQRSGIAAAAGVGLFTLLVWLAVRRWPAAWAVGLALALSTGASVFGVTTDGPAPWLMISAAFGLASWDLILLDVSLAGNCAPVSGAKQAERLETAHYQSLALALGAGLLLSLVGRLIHFHIPFIFMLLLVALAYFSLDRLIRALNREFHR